MKPRISAILFLATLLLSSSYPAHSAYSQDQDGESEQWLGVLDVGVAKLRLQIDITFAEDGTPLAKLTSLDQNNAEIKVDSLTIDGNQVEMTMPQVKAKYSGVLNDEFSRCEGTFTQHGKEYPLTFTLGLKAKESTHIATWAGTLVAGEQSFDFQLRVFEDEDKNQSAKLDSFSESAMGLPTEFSQTDQDFTFKVPVSGARYQGQLSEDKTKVTGKWKQRGNSLDLEFVSVPLAETRKAEVVRPQTPKGPFPYDSEELTVLNASAKLSLSGTLTTPKGDGPFATVILVSGSGPQDRDETILGHKPFAVIADHLTRAGLAVFRYDERGVGKSTGTYDGATTEDFANDVESIIAHLRKHDKVRKSQIGIIGHSEGGLVAPMVASKDRKLGFIVLMAGPGVPGKQILLTQSRAIAAASGVPEAALDINEKVLKAVLDQLTPDSPAKNIADSIKEQIQKNLDPATQEKMENDESTKAQFTQLETPWFRFFNVYDPLPALKKTRCPVLSVIGEKDLQVDCEMNQVAIEGALKAGKNPDYTISRLPNLNHLFQECDTGSPTEYRKIQQTISPDFLNLVTEWILERVD